MLHQARNSGNFPMIKRILAVLAVSEGTTYSMIATTLKVSKESIRLWTNTLLLKGLDGLKSKKASGRPSKLTKTQRKEKEIHLHHFPTFDSLKDKVEEALLHFKDLKNEVLSLFGFYKNLAEA